MTGKNPEKKTGKRKEGGAGWNTATLLLCSPGSVAKDQRTGLR